jgi:hypothetical protein
MNLKILALSVFTIVGCTVVQAQSLNIQVDRISWAVDGMTDLNANESVPYQCRLVTIGDDGVDWVQENGNFVLHFSVTGKTGEWIDPAENGSITYSIDGEGLQGELTISRTTQGLSAVLHLTGGNHEINHSYSVQSYEEI